MAPKAGRASELLCVRGLSSPQPKIGSNPGRTQDIISITRMESFVNTCNLRAGKRVCLASSVNWPHCFRKILFTQSLPTQVIQNFEDASPLDKNDDIRISRRIEIALPCS